MTVIDNGYGGTLRQLLNRLLVSTAVVDKASGRDSTGSRFHTIQSVFDMLVERTKPILTLYILLKFWNIRICLNLFQFIYFTRVNLRN